MKNVFFFCLFALGLISCNRNECEGTSIVKGVLIDNNDRSSIINREVILYESNANFRLFNGTEMERGITKTDSSGKFYFNFEAWEDYKYSVRISDRDTVYKSNYKRITKCEENNITLEAQKY